MCSRQYKVNINFSCEVDYNNGVLSWYKLCSRWVIMQVNNDPEKWGKDEISSY
jgi:hypothetical protein